MVDFLAQPQMKSPRLTRRSTVAKDPRRVPARRPPRGSRTRAQASRGPLSVRAPESTFSTFLYTQVVMQEIVAVCDPAEAEWWATSLGASQAERLVVTAADNCL